MGTAVAGLGRLIFQGSNRQLQTLDRRKQMPRRDQVVIVPMVASAGASLRADPGLEELSLYIQSAPAHSGHRIQPLVSSLNSEAS